VSETAVAPVDERVDVAPGVSLHVRCWAAPGVPFVLVHGLASNARVWDGVAARLAGRGLPAYAVDLRGHGESDRPQTGYDTETAAADVAALIERLRLDRPVLAGQSWGGNVVAELAARRPGLVRGLALLDGGWLHLSDSFGTEDEAWAALAPPPQPMVRLADVRTKLRRWNPDWPESGIEGTLGNFEELPDGTARVRLRRDRHESILRSMWRHHPRELYPSITVPTLLLPAGRRGRQGVERVAEAATELPHAQVRWYEGAAHDLHAQYPDRVAADLAELAGPDPLQGGGEPADRPPTPEHG
jgi:pimeloyl-ACP methyl ester carboxylesterase